MTIFAIIIASVSAEVVSTFNITLDTADMEIADSYPNVDCFVSGTQDGRILYAEIITFMPTVTDTYSISVDNVNPPDDGALVAVYAPNFVMGSAGTNCLDGTFDGRLTIELVAGQTYEILTTINEFNYTGSYTVTIEDSTSSCTSSKPFGQKRHWDKGDFVYIFTPQLPLVASNLAVAVVRFVA